MADTNISNTTTTTLATSVSDYSVDPKASDGINASVETRWSNNDFTKWFGYYKKMPELKKAIDALATYTVGAGWTTESTRDEVTLEHIWGAGEDTFKSILWNMLVIKKINGDAYAEVVRDDDGNLINLKPLDPATVTVVYDKKGLIKHYEISSKLEKGSTPLKLKPRDMFHLSNDRVADEIHGTSVVEACEWVILARNEAMSDKKRVHHRSTIRVMEVDHDDTTKLNAIKTQYMEAIKNGELMLVPKGNINFVDAPMNYIDTLDWIKYLENFFYQAVGVPKIILGGSEEFTEASSKIALLTFDQIWKMEQDQLSADIWSQLAIRLTFYEPTSLKNELITSEAKNTGQMGMQPNDTTIGSGAA